MVEIIGKELREIVVFEHVKYRSPEELARVASLEAGGFQPPVLRWVGGIAFRVSLSPLLLASEFAAKEFVGDGRVHVSVDYAEMSQYKPTINAAEEKVVIPILDDSPSPVSRKIVEWLKQQKD